MEEGFGRYLSVFLPFIATLICAHFIVRLVATAIAVPLIIGVDLATGGDLFLHPRLPGSQLLMTLLLVAVVLVFTIGRFLVPIARRLRRAA